MNLGQENESLKDQLLELAGQNAKLRKEIERLKTKVDQQKVENVPSLSPLLTNERKRKQVKPSG